MGLSRSAAAGEIIQMRTCRAVTPAQEAEGERGERTVRSGVTSSSAPITCTRRVVRVVAWMHAAVASIA